MPVLGVEELELELSEGVTAPAISTFRFLATLREPLSLPDGPAAEPDTLFIAFAEGPGCAREKVCKG